jgi:acyl-CoA thioester hydrolase
MPGFSHSIRVRYGECDMQGVVFNPNYLVYIDDAIEQWFEHAIGRDWQEKFDGMVKKMTVEWFSPATNSEVIDFALSVTRWGNSSFDITVEASVGERAILTAVLVYVSVTPGGKAPCTVPDTVRAALGNSQSH